MPVNVVTSPNRSIQGDDGFGGRYDEPKPSIIKSYNSVS
jgi:hypothetical protein